MGSGNSEPFSEVFVRNLLCPDSDLLDVYRDLVLPGVLVKLQRIDQMQHVHLDIFYDRS